MCSAAHPALNYNQNLQPWLLECSAGVIFFIAGCTNIKLFGAETLGSTQLTHQSSQALSFSLLTLPFMNIFGIQEGILCPALPFSMQLLSLLPTLLISASETFNNSLN